MIDLFVIGLNTIIQLFEYDEVIIVNPKTP